MADEEDSVPEGMVRMYHPDTKQYADQPESTFEAWKSVGWQKAPRTKKEN